MPLFPTLKFVACRSAAERQTLLSLLSDDIARQWAPLIRLGIQGLFERKWTYVEEVVPTENQIIFRFNPDTKTPGPFQVYLSYNEEKRETGWIWTGQKDMLQDSWSVKIRDAKWGQVVLRLDDSLAFQGTLVFDSVPF